MQCALFQWARIYAKYHPGLDLLSCSLNGVKLTKAQAGKAKAAGMLQGELDIKLPVARGGYNGLAIELKHGKNKATKEQIWYGTRLEEEGWFVAYCWEWTHAAQIIQAYLTSKLWKPNG
jgi:hypothetical protein